ncbi:hypothetical protein CONLIGDRAFT_407982 [Coniochaeta ligniaria NRRL 30616]|uniref:Uncharacterized protein n=1 Tax=Coniochaeta ligniaria NRRL 30616 TaxID=1408157 RepID=A0A1J7IPL8_9PEZI|nr:hypothetical protein CONLIGDRAFT_407982 [Coniochaeta ligniaria NRRL 30616]
MTMRSYYAGLTLVSSMGICMLYTLTRRTPLTVPNRGTSSVWSVVSGQGFGTVRFRNVLAESSRNPKDSVGENDRS